MAVYLILMTALSVKLIEEEVVRGVGGGIYEYQNNYDDIT
jgi:hypothetical protein